MIDKKTIVGFVAGLAVAAAVAVPFQAFSQINIQIGDQHHRRGHHGFPHPEIDAALSHLVEARSSLQNAAHHFGGHRIRAIKAVNEAINQCNRSVDYANNHDR